MIDDATKQAILHNAVLIANADGRLDPAESTFLREFLRIVGVSAEQAAAWHGEVHASGQGFAAVTDPEQARRMLEVLVGVAAADGRLDEREWHALFSIAKAADIPYEEVRELVQSKWGTDVLAGLAPSPSTAAPVVAEQRSRRVLAVTDHFDRLEPFIEAAPTVEFHRCPLGDVGAVRLPYAIFHTAEDRDTSLKILAFLHQALPDSKAIAVVRRDQAPQVSYLLQGGVCRCIIEDVHPGEFERLLRKVEFNQE